MAVRVWLSFLLAFLLAASPIAQVAGSQSEEDAAMAEVVEDADLGYVGDDTPVSSDAPLSPAPGVETVCVFPKNAGKIVPAGEETELLVGLQNDGESTLNVVAVHSTLHLPYDHRMYGQNLTVQSFYNASVPVSVQATFPYTFAVSKFLQPGAYDLVGYIVYEIDQHPYQNVFYNGTIEVVEVGGLLSVESVFLITLGIALLGLFGLWAYGQVQQLSKLKPYSCGMNIVSLLMLTLRQQRRHQHRAAAATATLTHCCGSDDTDTRLRQRRHRHAAATTPTHGFHGDDIDTELRRTRGSY